MGCGVYLCWMSLVPTWCCSGRPAGQTGREGERERGTAILEVHSDSEGYIKGGFINYSPERVDFIAVNVIL